MKQGTKIIMRISKNSLLETQFFLQTLPAEQAICRLKLYKFNKNT